MSVKYDVVNGSEVDDIPEPECISFDTAVFAHGVNNQSLLKKFLSFPNVNIFEADIIGSKKSDKSRRVVEPSETFPEFKSALDEIKEDAGDNDLIPVMGHNFGDMWDLSLEEWLTIVALSPSPIGIKLDIKDYRVAVAVCETVKKVEAEINAIFGSTTSIWGYFRVSRKDAKFFVPTVFVNADVLTGSYSYLDPGCLFNPQRVALSRVEQLSVAKDIVRQFHEQLPSAILSLGWSTAGEYRWYTDAAIEDMTELLYDIKGYSDANVTLPVRATYLKASWGNLMRLYQKFPASLSFTVWSPVSLGPSRFAELMEEMKDVPAMFDIPDTAVDKVESNLFPLGIGWKKLFDNIGKEIVHTSSGYLMEYPFGFTLQTTVSIFCGVSLYYGVRYLNFSK